MAREMRFLGGVTGHDPSKAKPRCARCGKEAHAKPQPSAAVLSGVLPAETAVPAPPDLVAALRAARTAPSEPQQRSSLLTPPPLPTEAHTITALTEADTVPSPSLESFVAAVSKNRKFK